MFVLIETADIEILSVRVFTSRERADAIFDRCAEENSVSEALDEYLVREAAGTLRLAGDDSYAVQLLKVDLDA